jgi:hypothetical protein
MILHVSGVSLMSTGDPWIQRSLGARGTIMALGAWGSQTPQGPVIPEGLDTPALGARGSLGAQISLGVPGPSCAWGLM